MKCGQCWDHKPDLSIKSLMYLPFKIFSLSVNDLHRKVSSNTHNSQNYALKGDCKEESFLNAAGN